MFPRRHLPSLSSLLALEALDRLGTATAAAAELALTQGAISKQLQVLEDQLGVPLLMREGKRLVLTPAARDFVSETRKALKIITDASLTLRANPKGGALNLAILPAFGMHWLAPRLAAFARAHPEVTVNLSTRLRPFDFAATAFDAAIHYGRRDWPGVSYLKLMDEEILAVASPHLLLAPLTEARQVLDHPLLQLESRTGDWGRWLQHLGHPTPHQPAMLFDQFATMTQAAVHGLGLALLPTFLIDRELRDGLLVPAFGPPVRAIGSYYLVWPEARPQRAPLVSFRDWLAQTQDLGRKDQTPA
ncbi:MAG: LysR family transcriptional regulator [Fuscovulum sp.]|nr:LysR family transcriptional regulator [Fuscovulum sp.]